MKKYKIKRAPKVFQSSYRPPKAGVAPASIGIPPIIWQILAVALLVLVVYYLPFFRIKGVIFEGEPRTEVQAEFERLVGVPIFSGEVSYLSQRWLQDDYSIKDLHCRKGLPNIIRCGISYREPSVVWESAQKRYLVDDQGMVFSLDMEGKFQGITLEDHFSQSIKLGERALSAEIIDQLKRVTVLLNNQGIIIKKYLISDSLYQPTAITSSFKINDNKPIEKEISIFLLLTESLEAQEKILSKLFRDKGEKVNEYVDLRVPGYVYYK